jgi:hypothetical protein
MKKMMKTTVVMAMMLIPLFMQAQSPIDKVAQKYTGKKGFKVVNISKDMLQLFVTMADKKDTATQAFKRTLAQMTGMKVIDVNCDSVKPALSLAFYNEATAAFPTSLYPELITGNDGYETIRFLTKKNPKGQIMEFVMLEKGDREIVVLSITGIIDLATVSKIAEAMDIRGMENLKHYKETKKK